MRNKNPSVGNRKTSLVRLDTGGGYNECKNNNVCEIIYFDKTTLAELNENFKCLNSNTQSFPEITDFYLFFF